MAEGFIFRVLACLRGTGFEVSTGLPDMAATGMGGGAACLLAFTRSDLAIVFVPVAFLNSSSWFRASNTCRSCMISV